MVAPNLRVVAAASLPMRGCLPSPCLRLQVLPTALTLSVTLLACWHLRLAVSPLDLARWAMSGQLPYLDCGREAGSVLVAYHSVLSKQQLLPSGMPTGRQWHSAVLLCNR